MVEILIENMAPLMFASLVVFLLMGYPVAFTLVAVGLTFFVIANFLGLFTLDYLQAIANRNYGVLTNELLLAVPFFTFMGMILERSGMAEDLLDTVGQIFGSVPGGLAYTVVLVGALLAATTGVVAASVISMGLISLPIMLRYGYERKFATGVITASGTLAQIIPPSLVLIIMADQLGVSVGDMYLGAILPGLMLTSLYLIYVFFLSTFGGIAPALPEEANIFRDEKGNSGFPSLVVAISLSVLAGVFGHHYFGAHGLDPSVHMFYSGLFGFLFGLAIITADSLTFRKFSIMTRKVFFVLSPPLVLIVLVLGTVLLGLATPTEGGAMGAVGAIILAIVKGRLNFETLKHAIHSTAKLSSFVIFILIGSGVFSLVFYGFDGHEWVKHLLGDLPGGALGFLIIVSILVFFLAFFLDFFEIAFILIPLLAPVAVHLDINLVFFGVLLAVNMQSSFISPPFGFALFYIRSVAPKYKYFDKVIKKDIEPVKTSQIYLGAIPFLIIQVCMIILLITYPDIVLMEKDALEGVDLDTIEIPSAPALDGFGDDQGFGLDGVPSF